jgi:allophanate hydrolase
MHIKVIKPGLATSVQDAGRNGYYHLGIPPSGALDQYSFRAANLLLGNPETTAVLECTLLGPQLQFSIACRIAVCGADMLPLINGQPQATHQVIVHCRRRHAGLPPATAGCVPIWRFPAGSMCRRCWAAAPPIRWGHWVGIRADACRLATC